MLSDTVRISIDWTMVGNVAAVWNSLLRERLQLFLAPWSVAVISAALLIANINRQS
jgi:hypothetical protein